MRYGASRALRKRHEALRCVTERHDIKRHERHEGGIHDLAVSSIIVVDSQYNTQIYKKSKPKQLQLKLQNHTCVHYF